MATQVRHDTAGAKYVISVDGVDAGLVDYQLRDGGVIDFTHTEIGDAYQGQGLAGILVRGALDDVRGTTDLRVVATCPYVKAWVDKHPDYSGLTSR